MTNRFPSSIMVMTLCPRCLSFYRNHPEEYEIERLSNWNGPMNTCSKCEKFGYDYKIIDK